MRQRTVPWLIAFVSTGMLAPGCSGGGGGSSASFQLPRISVSDNAVWKVNQEIVFTFSAAVDFTSVSLNTINLQTLTGEPATGSFFLRSPNVVVFQPNCPTRADLSDTGFRAGGIDYRLTVLGKSSGATNTVRSTSGEPLDTTQVRNFSTPTSTDAREAFLDTAQGAPVPVVRDQGSSDADASYIEIGGDPDDRVYFERDASQDLVLSVPGFEAPLNLYSEPSSRIAFVIEFNQAVHPAASNISSERLRLEFLSGGLWLPLETAVTLVANCTETGARVRLEPVGVLPRATEVRAVVLAGFLDLVGDPGQATIDNFAVTPTVAVDFTSLSPADSQSDEFPESFDFGGESPLSFQDTEALFAAPAAAWENGRLTAAFAFEGTGGPGGDFDWLVEDGDSILVDTDDGAIVADDDVTVQTFDDGVIDVRNLTIEAGGEVRVQGSQPLVINATGDVIIRGTLDVSGFDANDVVQLNTGNVVELGGPGGPGGGRGGNANEVVTNSTARGSFGQGPLDEINAGGQGGESGFAAPSAGKDARRPGGGAGGRFALDQGIGLSAESGFAGSSLATGAVSGAIPPAGGSVGLGPFVDGLNNNNFFGTRALGTTGNVTGLVRGELPALWGGYGGGGGGNALPATQFPTPNWTPSADEKGGAGGGGGGTVHIRALGRIVFGTTASAVIRSNGGRGAIGENTLGQDHIGGNGGSGSGGQVILETAQFIDFTDGGNIGAPLHDWIAALGGPRITGATTAFPNTSWGGAGGPGVIQLHVPEPLTPPSTSSSASDIVVPAAAGVDLDRIASPAAVALVPAFGARSLARSEWISIGAADQKPLGVPTLVQFLFQGIQTATGADEGKILTTAEEVTPLSALLDEDLEDNPDVTVLADRLTLQVSGSSLDPFALATNGISNDLYLRNPALLEGFVLRLSAGSESQDFVVASGSYDEGAAPAGDELLRMTVADEGVDLVDFITANGGLGVVHYELVPRYFRVITGGVEGSLPATSFVRIRFQAAADDGFGEPDESSPLVDWTGDISRFNALAPNAIQFFRFEVEFDLAATGVPVTADTPLTSLDFLKIPFVF